MLWHFIHYPAGTAPSRECAVRAPNLDAARRRLARAMRVPAWSLRALPSVPDRPADRTTAWRITYYPAGTAPSRDHVVRARTHEAAKHKLAAALTVPVWTLR